MPGYQLDGPDNTTPVGQNAVAKQTTTSHFVNTAAPSSVVTPYTQDPVVALLSATAGLTVAGTDIAPKMSTLTDAFNVNGAVDATKWFTNFPADVSVVGNQLQIAIAVGSTDQPVLWAFNNNPAVDNYNYFDLTGSYALIQLVNAGPQTHPDPECYPILLQDTSNTNQLFWYVNGGQIGAFKWVNSVQTQIGSWATYSATTHAWLRIREASGTTFFDYSSNGTTWVNFGSTPNIPNINQLNFAIQADNQGAVETFASTFIFDNLNLPPASTVTLASTSGLTVAAAVTEVASVPLAASAGMSVAASVHQLGSVTLAGGAALNVSALVTEQGNVSMAATTSLTAAGVRTQLAVVPLASTAGLSVAASDQEVATVALSGSASMAVASLVQQQAVVSMATATGLTVAGLRTQFGAVSLVGTAGLTTSAFLTQQGVVALEEVTTELVVGSTVEMASAVLQGGSTALIIGSTVEQASAVLQGGTSALIVASVVEMGSASLQVGTALLVVGSTVEVGAAVLQGGTSVLVIATTSQMLHGFAQLSLSLPASPSYVQGAAQEVTGQNAILAFPSNVTAGDLIVVAVGSTQILTESYPCTDTQGNTYTQSPAVFLASAGYEMRVMWAIAQTTGPCTVTVGPLQTTENFYRQLIHEYYGYGPLDVQNNGTFSGSTATLSMTTTVANDLLFAWCVDNNGVNSYSAPMAVRLTAASESTGDNAGATNSAGVNTVTANTAGGGGGMITVAFKPTAAPTDTGAVSFAGASGLTVGASVTEVASVSHHATAGMTVGALVTELASVTLAGGAALSVSAIKTAVAAVAESASSSLTVAAQATEVASVPLSATASLAASGTVAAALSVNLTATVGLIVGAAITEIASVQFSAASGLSVTATTSSTSAVSFSAHSSAVIGANPILVIAHVALVGTTSMSLTASLPAVITGQVGMASQAALTLPGEGQEAGAFQAAAVASLFVAASVKLAGDTVFRASGNLAVNGVVVPAVRVAMAATASMMVVATVERVGGVEPSLEDQIAAVGGQDPILMGATGYMDSVFTTRLVGDTE